MVVVVLVGGSATLDARLFADYFGGPSVVPCLNIPGRTFPVQAFYLEDVVEQLRYTPPTQYVACVSLAVVALFALPLCPGPYWQSSSSLSLLCVRGRHCRSSRNDNVTATSPPTRRPKFGDLAALIALRVCAAWCGPARCVSFCGGVGAYLVCAVR